LVFEARVDKLVYNHRPALMNTNPSFDASVLRGLEFELAYLASLTRAGLKPLSRWEKPFGPATQQALHELGLKSRVVTRTVQSGKRLRELIFSTSKDCLDGYARRFDQQAVERTAAAMRAEGLLFGYPSCCVESFISRGYARNHLRRRDQRLLFHWACPHCPITPRLLPAYRRVFRQCRRARRGALGRALASLSPGPLAARLGMVAALASGLSLAPSSALAQTRNAPDPHWLPLPAWEDPDADLLTSGEETILGKNPANPDENANEVLDGAELAWALALAMDGLPSGPAPDRPYIQHFPVYGLEYCQICGAVTNMGFMQITNPLENQSLTVPYIARHFLEHGSFSYSGTVHSGRLNPALLQTVLMSTGLAHFLPETGGGDADNDGLRNWEEAPFGCDPALRDTDLDQVIDGIEAARALRAELETLPRAPSAEQGPKDRPFVVEHPMDGVETCPRCGDRVVMGIWEVINPVTGLSLSVPSMGLHYLEHGGFAWQGGQLMGGQGRVDALQLKAVLAGHGGAHLLPVEPDTDHDLLTDEEERDLGSDPLNADQDLNQVADGLDLARRIAGEIAVLPGGPVIAPLFRLDFPLRGLERCDICGTNVNMGHLTVCNPLAQLYAKIPYIALHYLEHGSFTYAGDVHGKCRCRVRLLVETLHSPGPSHFTTPAGDSDADGLTDEEEACFLLDPNHPDTDGDGVPDGFALATSLWEEINALPRSPNPDAYVLEHPQWGLVNCPVCGAAVNMGSLEIVNLRQGPSLMLSYLNLHYLAHGSFAVSSTNRVDPVRLDRLLCPTVMMATGEAHITLRWRARPGHQYQLYTAPDPTGPWSNGPVFQGNGTVLTFEEEKPAGSTRKYYKISVTPRAP
ncbi:MAG TPA: hypothetical protein P5233_19705, partial [Candidatus Paceibacterota bacterium]|nr:hypothetical protein [Candidatus Paceibacterota bacterium]